MSALPVTSLASRSFVALGCVATFLSVGLRAQDADDTAQVAAGIEQRVKAVFAQCQQSVVRIEASDAHGRLAGTGFFIDPNGTLYTSYSVGGETDDIIVTFGGVRHRAQRMISDLRSGIAILKVDAETPFLVFGDSRDLSVASPVMTVGYPFDLPITPGLGIIGGRDIKYSDRYFATVHLRANLPVQRGQGGAPMLNLRGQVVGILISSIEPGGASFALPIEAAEKVRRDFLRFHEVRRGWLGFELEALAAPQAGTAVVVKAVFPDSPAARAGVLAGDLLLQIGDHAIATTDDVVNACFFLTAGDSTSLRIVRDAQEIPLEVQPVRYPGDLNGQPLQPADDAQRLAPAFIPGPGLTVPRLDEN